MAELHSQVGVQLPEMLVLAVFEFLHLIPEVDVMLLVVLSVWSAIRQELIVLTRLFRHPTDIESQVPFFDFLS